MPYSNPSTSGLQASTGQPVPVTVERTVHSELRIIISELDEALQRTSGICRQVGADEPGVISPPANAKDTLAPTIERQLEIVRGQSAELRRKLDHVLVRMGE